MPAMPRPSRSFAPDGAQTVTLDDGRIAHAAHVDQSEFVRREMYEVRPGVWSLVGNGLSNQSFVEGPDGIIAIDTGESNQEMGEALDELARVTDRPVVAVLYTHFHYVGGTQEVIDRFGDVPIYGHAGIDPNRARTASVISPAYGRGLVEQFGITLPPDGPDGLVNVGLGHFYRNPAHAPFTVGYVSPTETFDDATTIKVAGLAIDVQPAPSDADDSVTFWFPSLGVAVNNLVWPVLFNVFAIRGEEYRDPRVLLTGLDHLHGLGAAHLVGAHGPPMSGASEIARRVLGARDAIQFLWDQTVRHTNRGATSAELAHLIQLPDPCDADPLTSEFYGVAEHHVRQIRTGLFGFFDGEAEQLFPVEPVERAERLIAGFGGADVVRRQVDEAIDGDDLRWALQLASWLARAENTQEDRERLARALRLVARRTSSANVRNWCLTRARHLDGSFPMDRYLTHRITARAILADPAASIEALRVLVVPERMRGLDVVILWDFGESQAALHVRNEVAVPLDPIGLTADATLRLDPESWVEFVTGKTTLARLIAYDRLQIEGRSDDAYAAIAGFDLSGSAR
ncbi:MAG: alkyl sulfatase dimerization domain-containing protein [Actinomycetota bacterium]